MNYGGYNLILFDSFNDGWNGASSIRVFVDGVLVVDEDLANGASPRIIGFSVFDTSVTQNPPLTLFDQFNGYFDYTVTGGTLRTSDTDPCAITTSSSNTLTRTIPAGATIEKAYLFWAHSNYTVDTNVTFEGQNVTADVVNQYAVSQISFFGMVSDVTSIIQGIPDPSSNTYDFSDLNVDNTNNTGFFCGSTTLGGWSLMIFYTEPSLPASRINLFNGFNGLQNATTDYTIDNFFAISSAGAKTTVLSWEGDQAFSGGEDISITTSLNPTPTSLKGDGDNIAPTENPFNSTIFDNTPGGATVNNTAAFGLDLDTYNIASLIGAGDTSVTTNVDVGGDIVILNAVAIKVTSNLIVGTVYEDINYPGGAGRDLATSSGAPIENATVELYDSSGNLELIATTDSAGEYVFAGMADGDYTVRVVNNTVRSTRGGGTACTTCLPIQTFRRNYTASTLSDVTNEVGGANPLNEDPGAVTTIGDPLPAGAQTLSSVSISGEGAVDLDFGFNFNTIVNTNGDGQGSLEQFIINSNTIDETGLDIEAHPNDITLDPNAGEDTSIFMIPTNADPLGRTTDPRYNSTDGYFDILTTVNLSAITGANTKIDGRTQTAYSGNTNTGSIGSGGTTVGTTAVTLPTYDLPEIQVRRDGNGYAIDIQGNNVTVRNIAAFANGNSGDGIRVTSGTGIIVQSNIVGPNAVGTLEGNTRNGIRINGGTSTVTGNYIAQNRLRGIRINNNGPPTSTITLNHITNNASNTCNNNGNIQVSGGALIEIRNNLIENAGAYGINHTAGTVTITDNTITTSGQNAGCNSDSGIRLNTNNASVVSNIINANNGSGIAVTGGTTSGNLISQNSIYNNGSATNLSLGIDINDDGVTINDSGDADTGPNGSLNFPIIESAAVAGGRIRVIGWVGAGATVEFFLTDIDQGTAVAGNNQIGGVSRDYGEGQVFIGSAIEGSGADNSAASSTYNDVDGNTDTTNRFDFMITLTSAIPAGSIITATATISNTTSEFGSIYAVRAGSIITNRNITFRVKSN
ncbi:beta strand repeat-containing protein [Aquimarina mytili]|uniref:Carboxypeptidase regulatory-like domain-containing protein n=1 Tax=Aquimarina mytili TaxID=874423 RepID=A0A937D950_9FLAO|nr:carboxypeptidase regulatory-like domain-containing protein [Aquimarina mytili]MBL0683367.1 carboxypeptidase regulatory-like domain-containing protein [Aquimarina mytili]